MAEPHVVDAADESVRLIMYCRSWCPDCRKARAWLKENDVEFVEVDVDDDVDARQHAEVLNDGKLHTPTFILGDGACVDFRPEKLKDLLGME